MKPETENWLKIARYDLKVAKGNLNLGFYLKVFENCHSALEKLIKGIITENQKKEPPKIHNLLKLCSLGLIETVKKDIKNTLNELNNFFIMSRYPDNFDEVNRLLSKEKAKDLYNKTERIFKWLEKKII